MTDELTTVDTNILFYSVDLDGGVRHEKAARIVKKTIDEGSCVLTLQALSEFFYAVTRKGKASLAAAKEQVSNWMTLCPVVYAQPSVLPKAMTAVKEYHLAFWDAFLWATAKEAGISKILTEDFQHERKIEGVLYLNPFL